MAKELNIEFPRTIKGHAFQQRVWVDEHRFIIIEAGRRGGKTNINGKKKVKRIYQDFIKIGKGVRAQNPRPSVKKQLPRLLYWAIAPTYSLNMAQWKIILSFVPDALVQKIDTAKSKIWLYPEICIEFKSADKPKNLVSEGLNGLWITETARIKRDAWNDNLRPCLSDYLGWMLSDTTPLGDNWYVDDIADYANPNSDKYDDEWKFYTWHTKDNTMLPGIDKEVEKARKTMPKKLFQRNYEASREAFEGQIYDEFLEEIHVKDFEFVPERYMVIVGGQDWGYVHKGSLVIVGITHDLCVDVIAEIALSKIPVSKPSDEYSGQTWVELAKMEYTKWTFIYDEKEYPIEFIFCGPDEPEHIDTYAENDLPAIKANNSVKPGIEWIQIIMHPDENHHSRFRVHPRCTNLIQNLKTQRWKQDKEGEDSEVPEKGSGENDFDSNDALRYALYSAKDRYFK